MKLKLILATMIGLSFAMTDAAAQTVTSSNPQAASARVCGRDSSKCDRAMRAIKKYGKDGAMRRSDRMARPPRDVYAGLNLTAEQRARLQALQERRLSQARERRTRGMAIDTSMTVGQLAQMRQTRDSARRDEQIQYLREVKEIIGPDQYVVFLENIVVDQAAPGRQMGKQMGKRQSSRHDKTTAFKGRHDRRDRKGADQGARSHKKAEKTRQEAVN